MTDTTPREVPPTSRRFKAGVALALLAVLAVAGFLALRQTARDGSMEARTVCERAVTEQLRAPATAQFGPASITQAGEGRWAVVGYVDAQNGFGALIRSNYACSAGRVGGSIQAEEVELE